MIPPRVELGLYPRQGYVIAITLRDLNYVNLRGYLSF
jgi:hypothetical protein